MCGLLNPQCHSVTDPWVRTTCVNYLATTRMADKYHHQILEFTQTGVHCGEGNGTPLQYSCLENPIDRGAWLAAVHGVHDYSS